MTIVLGADTDNYDLAVSVEQYQRFYNNGGRFCIVGCQTGDDNKNYTLTQILNAQDAGLRGPFVYEFLYWDDKDMDRMGHAASFGLPVAIDCEWKTGMAAGPDATVQRIQEAKDLLISLNAYWGIYTGAWWWPGNTRNSQAFAADPLWHAAYPYGLGVLPPAGYLPDLNNFQSYGGWTKPTVHQFADVCIDEPTWDSNAMDLATSEDSSEVHPEEPMATFNLWPDGSQRIEGDGEKITFYNKGLPVLVIGGDTPGQLAKLFPGDKYYNFAHEASTDGHNAPMVFSDTLTD